MDEIELIRDFSFDAAHLLPNVPEGHKCKRLHGHTFHFKIHLKGIVDEQTGWLMDFGDIKKVVKPLIENHLDHYYLNDVVGLEIQTEQLMTGEMGTVLSQCQSAEVLSIIQMV